MQHIKNIVIASIFLFYVLMLFWFAYAIVPDYPVKPYKPIDYNYIKERMKYHGTLYTYKDKSGTWRFKRDNKECKLW